MTECARSGARYFDVCLAQKISLRLRLNFQTESKIRLMAHLQLFVGKTFKLPLLTMLLEHFKAVYKIKKLSADDSKGSQVSFFFFNM